MSGVITGPYFKSYFNNLTSAEVGNMVAILEIGAFSEHRWQSKLVSHR